MTVEKKIVDELTIRNFVIKSLKLCSLSEPSDQFCLKTRAGILITRSSRHHFGLLNVTVQGSSTTTTTRDLLWFLTTGLQLQDSCTTPVLGSVVFSSSLTKRTPLLSLYKEENSFSFTSLSSSFSSPHSFYRTPTPQSICCSVNNFTWTLSPGAFRNFLGRRYRPVQNFIVV